MKRVFGFNLQSTSLEIPIIPQATSLILFFHPAGLRLADSFYTDNYTHEDLRFRFM